MRCPGRTDQGRCRGSAQRHQGGCVGHPTLSPSSWPAVGIPMVVWSQLHGGGQVRARDDASLFHHGIGRLAEQIAHRSAVHGLVRDAQHMGVGAGAWPHGRAPRRILPDEAQTPQLIRRTMRLVNCGMRYNRPMLKGWHGTPNKKQEYESLWLLPVTAPLMKPTRELPSRW